MKTQPQTTESTISSTGSNRCIDYNHSSITDIANSYINKNLFTGNNLFHPHIQAIFEKELSLTGYFLEQLQALDDTGKYIRIIGKKDLTDRNAVVSIQTPEIDMSQVAWQLDSEYGVMTRVGLHCAPNAHKTLGTYPAGTIRFSFGPENTTKELDYAIQGLKKILNL